MIKKQYHKGVPSYFHNFVMSHIAYYDDDLIKDRLKLYKATVGKSRGNRNRTGSVINVKWHDMALYAMFVLRWS